MKKQSTCDIVFTFRVILFAAGAQHEMAFVVRSCNQTKFSGQGSEGNWAADCRARNTPDRRRCRHRAACP